MHVSLCIYAFVHWRTEITALAAWSFFSSFHFIFLSFKFILYFQFPCHLVSISIRSYRFPAFTSTYLCHSLYQLNQKLSLSRITYFLIRLWNKIPNSNRNEKTVLQQIHTFWYRFNRFFFFFNFCIFRCCCCCCCVFVVFCFNSFLSLSFFVCVKSFVGSLLRGYCANNHMQRHWRM